MELHRYDIIEAELSMYSMILGEQLQTICKEEVIKKLDNVTNCKKRNNTIEN